MAEQTEDWDVVMEGVEALAGDRLTYIERLRLEEAVNHRARIAYRLYDGWPEFLETKTQRLVTGDGGIESVPTDAAGDDTGEDQVDTWLRLYCTEPYVDRSVGEYDFYEQDDKVYPIGYKYTYEETDDVYIATLEMIAGIAYMTTTSFYGTGEHYLKVGDKFRIDGATQTSGDTFDPNGVDMVVVGAAANVLNARPDGAATETGSYSTGILDVTLLRPMIWTSYTTRLTDEYGNGNDKPFIPRRWVDYLIRAGYADFLRADGQTEKAQAEELIAQEIIDREIYNLEKNTSLQAPFGQIRTHGSTQNR